VSAAKDELAEYVSKVGNSKADSVQGHVLLASGIVQFCKEEVNLSLIMYKM